MDIVGISVEAMTCLMEHDFPGNVRELENIIEQAFVLCRGGMIELHHLPPELRLAAPFHTDVSGPMNLHTMEKVLITDTSGAIMAIGCGLRLIWESTLAPFTGKSKTFKSMCPRRTAAASEDEIENSQNRNRLDSARVSSGNSTLQ